MAVPASLRPLRHRRFATVFAAGTVSIIGTWMETVAVGALVTQQTGQARWAALVAAAAFLPLGVLGPVGGVLADRLDRRRFLVTANLVEAGLATTLAVLAATGNASPGLVTLVVFGEGCSAALRSPFQQAILPDLVPSDDILGAASLGIAQFNIGRVVGPALAAAVIALGSFSAAFTVNAISFFAAVAALAVTPLPPPSRVDDGLGTVGRIRQGVRAARAEPACWSAIGLIAVAAFLLSPFIALVPAKAHALDPAGSEKAIARITGILTTAQGFGAVMGALAVVPLAERFGRRRVVVGGLLGTSAALAVYGTADSVVFTTVAVMIVGVVYVGVLSGLSGTVQLRAPTAYRARILSIFFVALGVTYPLGALIQGAVADAIGLTATTLATGACMVLFVAWLLVARPERLSALDGSDPATLEPSPAAGGVPRAEPPH